MSVTEKSTENDWLDWLDDIRVSDTRINKAAEAYEYWRRRVVSGDYNVFSESKRSRGLQYQCKNWIHMKRAAAVIQLLHADPMDYMQCQFILATPTSYPFPNNTYSRKAIENWKSQESYPKAQEIMDMMKTYQKRYCRQFDADIEDLVYDPLLPFTSWFRVCHMERGKIPVMVAREALEKFNQNPGIRRVISEEGYDLSEIENSCEEAVQE